MFSNNNNNKSDSKSGAQLNFIEGHSRTVDPEGQQLGRRPNLLCLYAHILIGYSLR